MLEEKVIITNEVGLHARPASKFLKEAVKYQSDIILIKDGVEFDAKSIMSILSMGASKGTELTLRCVGEDEKVAFDALKELIQYDLDDF